MKIIPKVKIGGIEYEVIETDKPSIEDRNIDGHIIYDAQTIYLKNDLPKDYKEQVFLHEIIHGIFDFCELEQDENIISRISSALYMVIKDNPELFKS